MASPFFPNKTLAKMKNQDISENDVLDVYHNGEIIKNSAGVTMMVRKYASLGYEIGLTYKADSLSGQHVILSAWKRERR